MPVDRTKRVTVLDVARRAGVSQGTVSRVVTGKNWVSDEARMKVESAVRDLGYVPNSLAQGLKAQRTSTVGALVSDVSNPLHGEFLAAAEERLRSSGYVLLVASTHGMIDQELALLSIFRSRVDGLIVAHSNETDARLTEALRSTGLPIVFHDRELNELGDAVVADHRAGAYAATTHLVGLGHRRIAMLTPPAVMRPGRERLAGYRQALAEAGLPHDSQLVCAMGASSELSFSEVKSLLALPDPPTAIISLGTRMLAGVLTAVSSAGLQIPKQLSLVGIGDTDLLRLHSPPITSVRWDIAQCGDIAAEMLLQRMGASTDAERPPSRARYVPVELVLRQSTLPPAAQVERKSSLHRAAAARNKTLALRKGQADM